MSSVHAQQAPSDRPLVDTTPYGSGEDDSITNATESAAITSILSPSMGRKCRIQRVRICKRCMPNRSLGSPAPTKRRRPPQGAGTAHERGLHGVYLRADRCVEGF